MQLQNDKITTLQTAIQTAYLDHTINSNLAYRPEFVSNNYKLGKKVLVSIEEELQRCEEFCISVAFITKSGITPLLQTLKDLEQKNIPGKILTTNYLMFTEPEALEKLAGLKNIELKMFLTSAETGGFHTKGYIFRKEEIYRIIIGSSNVTLSAITKNKEWNTKIVSTEQGELTQAVLQEFDELWRDKHTLAFEDFIDSYRQEYLNEKMIRKQKQQAVSEQVVELENYLLKPNKMQIAFVKNVMEMRAQHIDRALLLSSTGTGKSLASAFMLREMGTKRALFVVHREQIAKQTMKSYKRVFGSSRTYGLLSGNSRELEADFLFATMQMLSKEEILSHYIPEEFDVIILDECHHAGAESYQKIMRYFKPKFWLGMTASPDTNQYDIYSIFDHHIAYEIRLQQALEEDLLCPFHYFGITDLEINGEVFDDNAGVKNFSNLISGARVDYVIDKANYYGFSGDRVKGLIFCSRKDEAKELSKKFNERGLRTEVLTGEDDQERRESVIARLTNDEDGDAQLDYIFTVDIFNEGVDIPEINQVIMLRPTQSPVVFIQQLGRGLRKYEGKEYVVILDFIGNYMNNFMIPIALSGDRSYNKDAMRRYIREGARVIPGSSTIHFDEISKKRIYASIDTARTNDMKLLRESYRALKYKLGRIPTIQDFKKFGSVDVTKIFEKCGSYHNFLKKYEIEYHAHLTNQEEIIIEYFSKKLIAYKRIHELEMLKMLICRGNRLLQYRKRLQEKYHVSMNEQVERSVISNLKNEFPKEEERRKYSECDLVEKNTDGSYSLSSKFQKALLNENFKQMILELLNFGIEQWKEKYGQIYRDTNFTLYQKYTYEDVCRLLNWKKNLNAQNIGGYYYDSDTKTLPVFINYHKAEDAIAYEDRFVSEGHLIALSKHPRKITSSDAVHIYKQSEEDKNNRIFLFVRKNKDDNEAKEFYFLGEIFAEGKPRQIYMEKTHDNAFEIDYRLDVPVRSDIYDYIVSD
ncbi:MAG TPA: DEAD/DEAH box helicase [Candidatus Mediterraneibacter stercoripullorum]|nr:DEAD/DEAH box helicase [Candidatus Mediterraneibacter stercoripullorum]